MWITTKLLFFLYVFFNLWLTIKWGNYHELLDPWTYFVHAIGLLYIYCYSEFVNKFVKRNWLRIFFGIFLVTYYFIMAKYRYRVRTGFDYSILHDNFYEIFNLESAGVIQNTLKKKDFQQMFALIPILIFVQYKYKSFTRNIMPSLKKSGFCLLALIVLLATSPLPYGDISYTLKTVWDFHFGGYPKSKNYHKLTKSIFEKEIKSTNESATPNIFLVNIESFNSLYVEKKARGGKEITPVFNSLIKEGLYVDDFYGNSIQSIKGQYSVLCSKTPLIRGKASYNIESLDKLNCMPKVMKELGYNTLFHKCYSNPDFDNTRNFMKAIGFDKVVKTSTGHLKGDDRKRYIWGWGVQDNISYPQYLDHVEKMMKEGKPVFSMIHSVSHHMKFRKVPKEESLLYKDHPKSKHEHFLNSLNASDRYFGVFIEELKKRGLYENSIIIVTGDHSYPAGEHFFYDNQVSYYQEFFKTPLLVIWKGKLQPQRIKEKTYSHVDVMPTILDMIGYNGKIETMGKSILSNEETLAHLVQPYNGTYLGVVKWPWKYVWERRSNRDFLFNIAEDPLEKVKVKNQKVIDMLKPELDKIIFSFESHYRK